MRRYSVVTAIAVMLVVVMAVGAYANGATPSKKPASKPAPTVKHKPEKASTGAGPSKTTTAQKCYTINDMVTMTVSEAWTASNKNYDKFKEMVAVMTSFSAQKRGIAIPDTKEAGTEIGQMVRQRSEADPNQLLYAIVDSAVRDYGVNHGLIPK